MKKKIFDCVEMKRRGAEYVYSITKDMTLEEEVEYWRKRSEEFMRDQERLRTQRPPASAPTSPDPT